MKGAPPNPEGIYKHMNVRRTGTAEPVGVVTHTMRNTAAGDGYKQRQADAEEAARLKCHLGDLPHTHAAVSWPGDATTRPPFTRPRAEWAIPFGELEHAPDEVLDGPATVVVRKVVLSGHKQAMIDAELRLPVLTTEQLDNGEDRYIELNPSPNARERWRIVHTRQVDPAEYPDEHPTALRNRKESRNSAYDYDEPARTTY